MTIVPVAKPAEHAVGHEMPTGFDATVPEPTTVTVSIGCVGPVPTTTGAVGPVGTTVKTPTASADASLK